jgi:lipopolysaccharide transport protein LptA
MNKILLFLISFSVFSAGEITVIADRVVINKTTMISNYYGNAFLSQNSMHLRADSIKITKDTGASYQVLAVGAPESVATFVKEDTGIVSSANTILYFTKEGIIKLEGNAKLSQNDNNFTGNVISYDIVSDKVLMSGSGDSRVKLKIKL